ncbi:MAG TPA: hypothetical protein VIF10_10720 [Methylobacter sp.]|jgi:hypothetical protein
MMGFAVLSATAPCVAYMDVGKGREQEAEASPKAPTVGALDCCSRRNSTSCIHVVVGNCSVHCSTSSIRGVVPPDLNSMDGGNAARPPAVVTASQSSPSYAVGSIILGASR